MFPLPLQRRRDRAVAAPLRHASSAILVGVAAALPAATGLPLAPEGRPFLLVAAIALAGFLFGRAAALGASAVGIVLGTWLLPPDAGTTAQAMMALLPLPMIAIAVTGAAEAFAGVFRMMDMADARRDAERRAAGPGAHGPRQGALPPGPPPKAEGPLDGLRSGDGWRHG